MPNQNVDPRILALCEKVTAKRARALIDYLLEYGECSTEDLNELGYDHPPRVAGDVKEAGIPIVMTRDRVSAKTGRKIGVYRFGNPSDIKAGRIDGRKAFSKAFKNRLVEHYNSREAFTQEVLAPRYLQIDHRVPYQVAGDAAFDESNPETYMLIDASSQRAKSWSCENCRNAQQDRSEDVCSACFWASPESYTHVALEEVRRLDLEWRADETSVFDKLRDRAAREGVTVQVLAKRLLDG
ncbi:hypothetical protein RA27_18920 [Ruegeria sp. ANG-R]|uniref:hypothetical protein n=1 Tax=Ruegeria sp. ANG-R TaxID=1577903 RepID=UPI00057E68ED|nr:hypothetical protein [Ruegeria sp. ANG-R]KIC38520.1 hypothetical protein RA27_18920 [Ruegeria sp. ANG-R]